MTHLIDKDAIVAEKERRIEINNTCQKISGGNEFYRGAIDEAKEILSIIDTLEVKEVDLDNEYTEEVYSHLDSIKDTADRMTSGNFMHHKAAIKFSANTIAKVLELIGLKAQEGE